MRICAYIKGGNSGDLRGDDERDVKAIIVFYMPKGQIQSMYICEYIYIRECV